MLKYLTESTFKNTINAFITELAITVINAIISDNLWSKPSKLPLPNTALIPNKH